MDEFCVAFIGHRYIEKHKEVYEELYKTVAYLIEHKEFVEFLVGKNGEFDEIAASAVRRAQKDFGKANSSLVWVQAYKTVTDKYAENSYDEIIVPDELSEVYRKAALEARNKWMVDRCELLVAYVENKKSNSGKILTYGVNWENILLTLPI